jgi:hypothetical protein
VPARRKTTSCFLWGLDLERLRKLRSDVYWISLTETRSYRSSRRREEKNGGVRPQICAFIDSVQTFFFSPVLHLSTARERQLTHRKKTSWLLLYHNFEVDRWETETETETEPKLGQESSASLSWVRNWNCYNRICNSFSVGVVVGSTASHPPSPILLFGHCRSLESDQIRRATDWAFSMQSDWSLVSFGYGIRSAIIYSTLSIHRWINSHQFNPSIHQWILNPKP